MEASDVGNLLDCVRRCIRIRSNYVCAISDGGLTMQGDHIPVRIEFATYATTYGAGPYHPAITTRYSVAYWPNITFGNEDEAYAYASKALSDAYQAAANVANQWNIVRAR